MPGIVTRTVTQGAAGVSAAGLAGRYFVTGLFERGPVDTAVVVSSLADLATTFGDTQSYTPAYDDLVEFFAEGGGQAVIGRIVGPTATAGHVDVSDRAGVPVLTLTISAASPGAWATDLSYEVKNGSRAGTFTLYINYQGARVETWPNLASPAAAQLALGVSRWVRGTNRASATPVPDNNPANTAVPISLATGLDDRAAVTITQRQTALSLFTELYGTGVVACPGQDSVAIAPELGTHCFTFDRIGLLAGAVTDDDAAIKTLQTTIKATTIYDEYLGLVYPWITVPSGNTTKAIPALGAAAAKRAQQVVVAGPWSIPANVDKGQLRNAVGVTQAITKARDDLLYEAGVSSIRQIAGTLCLYGWRSLSDDLASWSMLSYRDTFNYVSARCREVLETYVYSAVDAQGALAGRIESEVAGILEPMVAAGALFAKVDANGDLIDPGYSVVASQQDPTALAAGQFNVLIGLRPTPYAVNLNVTLIRAQLTGAV